MNSIHHFICCLSFKMSLFQKEYEITQFASIWAIMGLEIGYNSDVFQQIYTNLTFHFTTNKESNNVYE